MISLQAPYPAVQTTSILPNPQFSDVESLTSTMVLKKSLNNTRRTYVSNTGLRMLTYSFRLTRGKALELREFIKAYFNQPVRLVNHKDETWIVYFTSNPFEFNGTERAVGVPGNEMQTITLNFEGELINV